MFVGGVFGQSQDYIHEPRKDAAADATRWSFRAEAPRGGRPEAAPAPAGYMPPAYPPGTRMRMLN